MQRCKAKSKRSDERCKNYAVRGQTVCRMHGAGGGPKTIEGRLRCKKAPLKHGFYTEQGYNERKQLMALIKEEDHLDGQADASVEGW